MKLPVCIFAGFITAAHAVGTAAADYAARPEVQRYISYLVQEHQFDEHRLTQLFQKTKKQHKILRIIEKPAESKPWYLYRKHFIVPSRIDKGVSFWLQYKLLFEQVERQYQIPPEIILAIIGVETIYGENTGSFPVIDTLVTLGFDYPKRSIFFRKELTALLLLMREESYLGSRNLKGSYAGAMGIGQFIPSSYRAYAVDFDGDGQRDLQNSIPDAVASVANYLAQHGWQQRRFIANMVRFVEPRDAASGYYQFNSSLKPHLEADDAVRLGIVDPKTSIKGRFALFSFEISAGDYQYWAGYQNFYTITRYNHSRRYAMAVYQLSREIKNRYMAQAGES